MSVILTHAHDCFGSTGKPCSACGRKLVPPFFEWHGAITFCLCKTCAVACKRGIALDLIQLSAIAEMHSMGLTLLALERGDMREIEKKERLPEITGVAILRRAKGKNRDEF